MLPLGTHFIFDDLRQILNNRLYPLAAVNHILVVPFGVFMQKCTTLAH